MVNSSTLRMVNITAAAVHFTLAAYWIYQKSKGEPSAINLSIYRDALEDVNGIPTIVNKKLQNVPDLETLLITFFLITGSFHVFYSLNINNVYNDAVYVKQNNYFRWIEYSITATIMINIVAHSAGISDRDTIVLMNVATVATMWQGQSVELALNNKGKLSSKDFNQLIVIPTLTGWLLMLGVFGTIIYKFNETISDVEKLANVDIPDWISAVVYSQFIFYNAFGIWQIFHIIKSNSPDFSYSDIELGYNVLSVLSKTTLGSILGYGLQQSKNRGSGSGTSIR